MIYSRKVIAQLLTKSFYVVRLSLCVALKPFTENTRRLIMGTLLYRLIAPIWPLSPSNHKFIFSYQTKGETIKFRPFVLHDFLFVVSAKDHEPYIQKVFQPKQGDVVIDVGAHIGIYTLKTAQMVGRNGTVVAVEPDPENFRLLQENIAINKHTNVMAVNAALSDSARMRMFYCSADPAFSGFQSNGTKSNVRDALHIETVTLNELLEKLAITSVDWIKLDVEGEELRVLKGAESVLRNSAHPKVILEISQNKDEIISFLKNEGFNTSHLGDIYFLAEKC